MGEEEEDDEKCVNGEMVREWWRWLGTPGERISKMVMDAVVAAGEWS